MADEAPSEVLVKTPDGRVFRMPKSSVQPGDVIATPADVEKAKTRAYAEDNPALAGAAGVARGASLGLSDLALTKTGLAKPETLKALQEYNPSESMVGEGAGFLGGLLLTPGASAVGLAGKAAVGAERLALRGLGTAAAETVTGKIAAKAAATALEGSLYGTGAVISESAIGNTDITAEKLFAGAGVGALLGGAGGALGAGVDALLAKRATKIAAGVEAAGAGELGGAAGEAAAGVEGAAAMPGGGGGTFSGPEGFEFSSSKIPTSGKEVDALVREHAGVIQSALDGLGIKVPTPEEMVFRAADFTGTQMTKVQKKGLVDVIGKEFLSDPRFAQIKKGSEELLALTRTKLEESGAAVNETLGRISGMAEKGQGFDGPAVADRIEKDIIEKIRRGPAADESVALKAQAEANKIRAMGSDATLPAANEVKNSFNPRSKFSAMATPEQSTEAATFRSIRAELNREIETKAEAIAASKGEASLFEEWKTAKTTFGAMNEFLTPLEKRVGAKAGNRFTSLTDYISGSIGAGIGTAVGGPVGAVLGGAVGFVGGAVMNKYARERLPFIMATALDGLRKSPVQKLAAESLAQRLGSLIAKGAAEPAANAAGVAGVAGAAPAAVSAQEILAHPNVIAGGLLGKYGGILANALARGTDSLWATHAGLWETDPKYRVAMANAGLAQETPDQHTAAVDRGHKLAAVAAHADAHDKAIATAVNRLVGKQTGPLPARPSAPATREERLAQHADKLAALNKFRASMAAAQPDALLPGEHLTSAAPAIAGALSATAARAMKVLDDAAPRNPRQQEVPALALPYEPADSDLARFAKVEAAVTHPANILREASHGTLTPAEVQAATLVYPSMMQALRSEVVAKVGQLKTTLTPPQKAGLSMLLGAMAGLPDPPAAPAQSSQPGPGPQHRGATHERASKPLKLTAVSTDFQRLEGRGK